MRAVAAIRTRKNQAHADVECTILHTRYFAVRGSSNKNAHTVSWNNSNGANSFGAIWIS